MLFPYRIRVDHFYFKFYDHFLSTETTEDASLLLYNQVDMFVSFLSRIIFLNLLYRNAVMFNNELMADIHFVVGLSGGTQRLPGHKVGPPDLHYAAENSFGIFISNVPHCCC